MNITELAIYKKMFGGGTGGGGSGIIEVDKLPTENIDTNAFYLCNGEYYRYKDSNTWVFNDVLTPLNKPFEEGMEEVFCSGYIYLTSRLEKFPFSSMLFFGSSDILEELVVLNDDGEHSIYYNPNGFLRDVNLKKITFIEDTTDEEFIAWRNANAKKDIWQKYTTTTPLYALSSVDELPSVADENAIAVVNIEEQQWGLNNEIELLPDNLSHEAFFTCQGAQYTYISCDTLNGGTIRYGRAVAYDVNSGWNWINFRNIIVYTSDETIKKWLNENGQYIGSYESANILFVYRVDAWHPVCILH